jgi:hypothetical protein
MRMTVELASGSRFGSQRHQLLSLSYAARFALAGLKTPGEMAGCRFSSAWSSA